MKNISVTHGMRKFNVLVGIVITLFINSIIPAQATEKNTTSDIVNVVDFDINDYTTFHFNRIEW